MYSAFNLLRPQSFLKNSTGFDGRRKQARNLNNKGMTLIEIMIVMIILGGLLAFLGKSVMDNFQKSRVKQAKIQIAEVSKQLEVYNSDCQKFPTTEQGLQALVTNPGADACPNWGPNPYQKSLPKDPWGGAFIYESDGSTFTLKSLGRDKKEGGEGYDKDLSSEDTE